MLKPTTELLQPTTGLGCPGILNDAYPPVIFAKRLNHSATLQLDYSSLFPFHLSPSKWFRWILFQNYLFPIDSTISLLLWINSRNTLFFIPTTTTITEVGTAELFFHHIISKFGIPRQVITYRDIRWRGEFWKEICNRMGMTRSLTTAYHPQADGQTEVLNQSLEICLRSYVGPSRDNWEKYLDALALSYNSTPHTATGFAPAYLL